MFIKILNKFNNRKMIKILFIVVVYFFNNLNSQALIIDSVHGISTSFEFFIDTETIVSESGDDYERKYPTLGLLDFAYVYNRAFEINFIYKFNESLNSGFMIPFKGSLYSCELKYHIKNIVNKILKNKKSEENSKQPLDFNINFSVDIGSAIEHGYDYTGYGFGFSWDMEEQSLVSNYSLYPNITYMKYDYSLNGENNSTSESYDMLVFDLLTKISIPPKDNKEVKSGFFVNPSLSIINSKDAYVGIQSGFYHNF